MQYLRSANLGLLYGAARRLAPEGIPEGEPVPHPLPTPIGGIIPEGEPAPTPAPSPAPCPDPEEAPSQIGGIIPEGEPAPIAGGEITGTSGDDQLHGTSGSDVFDADAGGNDTLHGGTGNDTYRLGAGTGRDSIDEAAGNSDSGDADDKIKIKSGIALANVSLLRSEDDLIVLLQHEGGEEDSLTVKNHFAAANAKVESIEADGYVLRENQFQALIDEIAAFTAGNSSYDSLDAIHSHYWEDAAALTASNT